MPNQLTPCLGGPMRCTPGDYPGEQIRQRSQLQYFLWIFSTRPDYQFPRSFQNIIYPGQNWQTNKNNGDFLEFAVVHVWL